MLFSDFCSAFLNSVSSCASKSTCVKAVFEAEKKTRQNSRQTAKKNRVEVVFFLKLQTVFFD